MTAGGKRVRGPLACLMALLVAVVVAPVVAAPDASSQEPGFRVEAGRLIDGNGNDFVMRGISHPYAWFRDEIASFGDIKATGANTVRVVVSSGDRYKHTTNDELEMIIEQCRTHQLICVLELHDTTGYPQAPDAIGLMQASEYWIRAVDVLRGNEGHVIINLGNEPFGNEAVADWANTTIAAVTKLRDADLAHTVMVDAPNWGQDWSHTMRDNAADVLASDPHQNVIFDVHMFGSYDNERDVRSYLESFVAQRLPLVVGEFGATHHDGDPDEDAIMHWAEHYGIGYMAWSWSGNVAPVADLNLVEDFDPGDLTPWGQRLIHGTDGIRETAAEASTFATSIFRQRQYHTSVTSDPTPVERTWPLDRQEAEAGTLNGLGVSVQGAGFEGDGYVNGLDTYGDSMAVDLHVPQQATYQLVFGYRARYGDKSQHLYINGERIRSVAFPATDGFERLQVSGVALAAGDNTVMIAHDWGWIELDYVEVWPEGTRDPLPAY